MDECACPAAIVANEGHTVVARSSWIEIPNEQAHQSRKQKKQPVSLLPNAGVHEITEKMTKQKSNTKEGTMLTKNWRTKTRWKRENKNDCSCTYI
jgi:hypothetical protein